MTAQAQKTSLNRADVRNIGGQRGAELIGWKDYGKYTFALKHFRDGTDARKPHYLATVHILASDHESWPVGSEAALYFATMTLGNRAAYDDKKLVDFLRAVARVKAAKREEQPDGKIVEQTADGEVIDDDAALAKLIAMGKIDHDKLEFRFERSHTPPKEVPVLTRSGEEVIGADGKAVMETVSYLRDYFMSV